MEENKVAVEVLVKGIGLGTGIFTAGRIFIPPVARYLLGQTFFIGLFVPNYFIAALGALALAPAYGEIKKIQAAKKNRKAEDINKDECLKL